MRILVFNWRDGRHPQAGGAEQYLHEGAAIWAAQGHDVALICANPEPGPRRVDTFRGIEVVRVGDRYRVYLAARAEYNRHWRGWADVVFEHINGIPFLSPLYVDEPVVAFIHHIVGGIFFEEVPLALAAIGFSIERTLAYFYRSVPIVTVSPSSREELIRIGFPPSHITIIPNGLEPPGRTPSLERTASIVLSLGRLKRYKRLDLLVDAARHVVDAVPEARFQVAGSGDYEPYLRHRIRERGLEAQFTLLGRVTEEEKSELLAQSKLLAVTSKKEGWGLTVLEAASYGTPTVGFDVPGVRDAVVDTETGILVPDPDPVQLAQAIVRLLRHEAERLRLADGALRRAASFRWSDTADRILRLAEAAASRRENK